MSKATRAPWKLTLVERWPFGVLIEGSDGSCVLKQEAWSSPTAQKTIQDNLDCVGFNADRIEEARKGLLTQHANARLIAASPDMLAALKLAETHIAQELKDLGECDHAVNICYCGLAADLEVIRGVIAKAEQ